MQIKILKETYERDYDLFLKESKNSLFYHSLKYKRFLESVLSKSIARYFLLFENKKIIAALPFFLIKTKKGNVLNSLPFFGSNGDIIYKDNIEEKHFLYIFTFLENFIKKNNIFSTLIIPNFLNNESKAQFYFNHNLRDARISQITYLPKNIKKNIKDSDFLNLFKSKSLKRNISIKKENFNIKIDNSLENFEQLFKLHKKNSITKNRLFKKWYVFKSIRKNFIEKIDYNIYCIKNNHELIAGLLVFYYKHFVEYYLPVTNSKYDKFQLMEKIILQAMKEAVKNKYSIWNWGSTWENQKGVFQFKNRWNANNSVFHYMIKTSLDINKIDKSETLSNFKYFYVIPFKS